MKKVTLIVFALLLGTSVFAQNKQNDIFKYVKSYLNQKAPELIVQEWLSEKPNTTGKFILFEVYGYHCPPCWKAVPKLNDIHAKYKDKLVVIGCSDTKAKNPNSPDANYYKGLDKERRTYKALALKFVPWALLIDQDGIVRWEGSPNDLTDEIVTKVLKKFKKNKVKNNAVVNCIPSK